MKGLNSKMSAEIRDAIREVLFRDWDPIGVNKRENLRNEYDSYIAPVYRILCGSRSEQELVEFLFRTQGEAIGLPCRSPELLLPVARKLLAVDVAP